jgi:hypothetical protein
MTLCSVYVFTNIFEEHDTSIFKVTYLEVICYYSWGKCWNWPGMHCKNAAQHTCTRHLCLISPALQDVRHVVVSSPSMSLACATGFMNGLMLCTSTSATLPNNSSLQVASFHTAGDVRYMAEDVPCGGISQVWGRWHEPQVMATCTLYFIQKHIQRNDQSNPHPCTHE